jgi:glycosidase
MKKKYIYLSLIIILLVICSSSGDNKAKKDNQKTIEEPDTNNNNGTSESCPADDNDIASLPSVKLLDCDGTESEHICIKNKKLSVYQLFVRLFSADNNTKSGVGTFYKITNVVLDEITSFGFNAVWLMGVIDHANPDADDVDIIKGSAGSPYAIRDYYAVSPYLGTLSDFENLVKRIHNKGMAVIIDLVPNHVARSYAISLEDKKELQFGNDDYTETYCKNNGYFYLSQPFEVPVNDESSYLSTGGDDFFPEDPAKVTGNNITSPAPSINDWYETVKLNYGYEFQNGSKHYPPHETGMPSTWKKMEDIIAYWINLGVDGFRTDMSHMVPPEFWQYAINKSRKIFPGTIFIAEAYPGDPAQVEGYSHQKLFDAGFNYVYDDPAYDWIVDLNRNIENPENPWWASGYDNMLTENSFSADYVDNGYQFIRYTENHDEVRSATDAFNHSGGDNLKLAKNAAAVLFALPGAFLFYNGQEVGENAVGAEGFGGDDDRTTIFDFWQMPEMEKYYNNGLMNGASLADSQAALLAYYKKMISFTDVPAFSATHSNVFKTYYPIFAPNFDDDHYFIGFVRISGNSKYVILANMDKFTDRGVTFVLTGEVLTALEISNDATVYSFTDELNLVDEDSNLPAAPLTVDISGSELHSTGLTVPFPTFKAHTALYLKMQ